MSEEALKERADQRLLEALERAGRRDPRDHFRERLRALRDRDERAFRRALEHYERRLVPTVAREGSDPLAEWLEYSRLLAELTAPGRTVEIDASGRARDLAPPVGDDRLVLHLPTAAREPAILVWSPTRLSAPQRATYDLLVKQALG